MNRPHAQETNSHGQAIGTALPDWTPPQFPKRAPIDGLYCRLEPLDANLHAKALFTAFAQDKAGRNWTYLPYGPFTAFEEFSQWLTSLTAKEDPQFYTVIPKNTEEPAGVISFLSINPNNGSIEVGHIHFSENIKQTPVTTEATFLMMKKAFELRYRRFEWKCDALNAPPCSAARRLGFSFEGIFRQATVYKGRNRDTAWFAMIDSEWPAIKTAFTKWLAPANFAATGKQIHPLSTIISKVHS